METDPLGLVEPEKSKDPLGLAKLPERDVKMMKDPLGLTNEKEGHWEGWVKPSLEELTGHVVATGELGLSLATNALLYLPSKAYGIMALPWGAEAAKMAEENIASLGYQPKTPNGQAAGELVGKGFEYFLKPAKMAGESVSQLSPRAGYLVETGAELAEFAMTGAMVRGAKGKLKERVKEKAAKKEVAEKAADIETEVVKREFQERFKGEKPTQKPQEPATQTITPKTFSQTVQQAANEIRGWKDGDRVYISDLYGELKKRGEYKGTLDDFKSELVQAHRRDDLSLVRADLVEAMDPALVKASKATYMNGEFHFIKKAQPKERPSHEPVNTTLYSGIPLSEMLKLHEQVGSKVWDDWVMQRGPRLLEKVPGGRSVNRALLYDYRGDLPWAKEYISLFDEMKRGQTVGREYGVNLGQRLQSFPEQSQLRMGEFIRGERPNLPAKEAKVAQEAKNAMLRLGRQAVDTGLLSEQAFFKNAGRYMPRLYTSKEYQTLLNRYGVTKPNRLDLSRFKARKDIPKEIRQEMGEILQPGYPIAKGITQLTHDIEMAKFFNSVAREPKWALPKKTRETIPEEWKQLPANKRLGKLSESYVHPEIFADLQEAVRVMSHGERAWRKALGSWKFGKVILSPKTHARNVMSNSILAHLGGLPMYEQPVYLSRAAKAMREKSEHWRSAKREGLLSETFTNAELRSLFDRVEMQIQDVPMESLPGKFGKIGDAWGKTKVGLNKAAKLYEAEEQWFKMAKYIHNVERKGMKPRDAALDAEKWLFNYSKLTKAQEKYRSNWYGAPFATFTMKSMPRMAEAAIKTPWRFALPAAMIYALEESARSMIGDTKEQAEAKTKMLPDWMRGQLLGIPNFARVPLVDDDGREYYLNLTYILPWGDLTESGGWGPIPSGLVPFSQPFVKEPVEQIMNWDSFYKEEIVKEEDSAGKDFMGKLETQVKERGKHLGTTMAPTPVIDAMKISDALRSKPDYRGRMRDEKAVWGDVLFGIKMYPVDYAEKMAQFVSKNSPKRGWLARKIKSEIKTLHTKKRAAEKMGANISYYEEKINQKTMQLYGLAEEVRERNKVFQKTK